MTYDIGFSWESKSGTRTIEALHELRGKPVFLIGSTGTTLQQIVPVDEIADEVRLDQQRLESIAAHKAAAEERRAQEQAETSLHGFEDTLSPKANARALATLNKQISVKGQFDKRKHHIERLIREGFRVVPDPKHGRIFEGDKSFFLQKDLTKIGLDYAEYLSACPNPAFVEICEMPGMFVYADDVPLPRRKPNPRGKKKPKAKKRTSARSLVARALK